jgi:hypothetical protein
MLERTYDVFSYDGVTTDEFGLVIDFIEQSQIVTTSNYIVTVNSHNLQFIKARNKYSESALSSPVEVPLLTDWRLSPTNLLLFSLPSEDSLSLYSLGTYRTENTASNSYFIVASYRAVV